MAEYGVEVGAAYQQAVDDRRRQLGGSRADEQRDALIEVAAGERLRRAPPSSLSARRSSSGSPSDEEATAAGTRSSPTGSPTTTSGSTRASASSIETGAVVAEDTSLTYALSDIAPAGAAEQPDTAVRRRRCRPPSAAAEPTVDGRSDEPLLEFVAVMRRLRAECAWKGGQTHRSLARYLLEETHETLEAIDTGDAVLLREELGDLLLQVYFHAVIAEEDGDFTLDDVAADIVAKMRRRNPHVFGAAPPATGVAGADQRGLGGDQGDREAARPRSSTGCPDAAGAALRRQGARPAGAGRRAAVTCHRTAAEGGQPTADRDRPTSGDRLLALVAEARESGTDPEQALRDAVRRLL